MSITDALLESVGPIATKVKKRSHKGYISGSAFFPVERYNEVLDRLERLTEEVARGGEKISVDVSRGSIVDSGLPQFKIAKGRGIELYDYETTTAAFIRVYHIKSSDNEWIALYVDENPHTPWWSEEERAP